MAVVSYETAIYENFFNSLQSKLIHVKSLDKTDITGLPGKQLDEYDLVIAIGSDASKVLSRTANINTLITTLIPGRLADTINKNPCLAKKCMSVLIEQPIERYFLLFKSIFPANKTLVIATTNPGTNKIVRLKNTSSQYNIDIKIITIGKDQVIARTLNNSLEKNDVLLALPDPNIYNKNTAKSIILSAYHKNVPIIAYSEAFAKAGALISLYSSFDDVAKQTAKIVNQPNNNHSYYPETFSTELNMSVASSLEIEIKDIDAIMRAIK